MTTNYVISKDDVIIAIKIIRNLNEAIKNCHILIDKQTIFTPFIYSLNHIEQKLFKDICNMSTVDSSSIIIINND